MGKAQLPIFFSSGPQASTSNDTLIPGSSFLAQRLSQRVSVILGGLYLRSSALAPGLCSQVFVHLPSAPYPSEDYVEVNNTILPVQRSNMAKGRRHFFVLTFPVPLRYNSSWLATGYAAVRSCAACLCHIEQ